MAAIVYIVLAVAGFLAGIVGIKLLLEPANALRLTIFRPYRRDAWPQGVQEDDSVRYDWSAIGRRRAPIHPTWTDIVVSPAAGKPTIATEPGDFGLEELTGESVAVEPVDPTIHRVDG